MFNICVKILFLLMVPFVIVQRKLMDQMMASDDHPQNRLCKQNQFSWYLSKPLSNYGNLMDAWLEKEQSNHFQDMADSNGLVVARKEQEEQNDWKRFDAFDVMGSCKMSCIGGHCNNHQTSKHACGIQKRSLKAPCTIYSTKDENEGWDFEQELLDITPCEVHVFDCKGLRFDYPDHDRLNFHHVCLGPKNKPGYNLDGETWTLQKAQQALKHTSIDLLKMNIEHEFEVFESWPTLIDKMSFTTVLPMQIIVDMSYVAYDYDSEGQVVMRDGFPKTDMDLIEVQKNFLKMGYAVVHREDNRSKHCEHCTELTLVRIRCPQ